MQTLTYKYEEIVSSSVHGVRPCEHVSRLTILDIAVQTQRGNRLCACQCDPGILTLQESAKLFHQYLLAKADHPRMRRIEDSKQRQENWLLSFRMWESMRTACKVDPNLYSNIVNV